MLRLTKLLRLFKGLFSLLKKIFVVIEVLFVLALLLFLVDTVLAIIFGYGDTNLWCLLSQLNPVVPASMRHHIWWIDYNYVVKYTIFTYIAPSIVLMYTLCEFITNFIAVIVLTTYVILIAAIYYKSITVCALLSNFFFTLFFLKIYNPLIIIGEFNLSLLVQCLFIYYTTMLLYISCTMFAVFIFGLVRYIVLHSLGIIELRRNFNHIGIYPIFGIYFTNILVALPLYCAAYVASSIFDLLRNPVLRAIKFYNRRIKAFFKNVQIYGIKIVIIGYIRKFVAFLIKIYYKVTRFKNKFKAALLKYNLSSNNIFVINLKKIILIIIFIVKAQSKRMLSINNLFSNRSNIGYRFIRSLSRVVSKPAAVIYTWTLDFIGATSFYLSITCGNNFKSFIKVLLFILIMLFMVLFILFFITL